MNTLSKNILEETKELFNSLSEGFLVLGENLFSIFTKELWKGKYDSYEEYIEWVGISPATASKLRQVYQHYVLDKGYDNYADLSLIPWTSLYENISIATSKRWIEEKVALAKEGQLRGSNLKEEKRIALKGECERHNFYTLKICKNCNYKIKVE
jgi:hypothetical protein